jgi:hypothetical protein
LAFSADRPIVDMEIDVGGFERACRNLPHLPIKDWVDSGEITCEQYPLPLQGVKMDNKGNVTFTASKQLMGVKELSYQFLTSYFRHLMDDTSTIVVDTGTLLYNTLICDGYLQELQERQLQKNDGKPMRTSLQQTEYREPYDRMRGITYQAKAHHKNLIMTHHATDEYKPMPQRDGGIATQATGNRVYHGWAQLGDSVDLMIHTYIKVEQQESEVNGKKVKRPVRVPYCKVDLATCQELIGTEFREPTLPMIIDTIKMIRGEE